MLADGGAPAAHVCLPWWKALFALMVPYFMCSSATVWWAGNGCIKNLSEFRCLDCLFIGASVGNMDGSNDVKNTKLAYAEALKTDGRGNTCEQKSTATGSDKVGKGVNKKVSFFFFNPVR